MAGGSGGIMVMRTSKPFVIAILGAESTGKSTLAVQLAHALRDIGHSVQTVPEYLREWCQANNRVPLQHEQAAIADAQSQRIQVAAVAVSAAASVVIADTTAVMTAVYSDYVFGDQSLYSDALALNKTYDLTLLMGLDVPWVADGVQRDGPHVREAVDALVRQALQRSDIAAPTIYGLSETRLQAALDMALQAMQPPQSRAMRSSWKHYCECCGDGECERLMGKGLIAASSSASQTPAPSRV